MKWLKRLGLAFAIVLLLAAGLAGLAFVPAVQRAIVLRAAGGLPGLRLSVDYFALRPDSVEVRNLHLEKDGLAVTAPRIVLRLSLLQAVLQQRVLVQDVEATGWRVELPATSARQTGSSAPQGGVTAPAKFSPAVRPFEGFFKFLQVPAGTSLGACDLAGEVVLPASAAPSGRLEVAFKGGHFAPGAEAKFDFSVRATGVAPASPVAVVETAGRLTVRCDAAGLIDHLAVDATTEAQGRKLPASARLHSVVALTRTGGGEHYDVALDLAGDAGPQRLATAALDFRPGAALGGSWSVHASREQVEPFAFGVRLPRFSVEGEGTFELDPTKLDPAALEGRFAGKLTQQLGELGVVKPELAALGDLASELAFDVNFHAGTPSLSRLDLSVSAAQPVLEAHLLQAVEISPATRALKVANPNGELFRLKISGLPLAWAQPFLPGFEIRGDDLRGEFVIRPRGDGFVLKTSAPVTVSRLSLVQAGRPLLKDATLSLVFTADHSPAATHAKIEEFSLTTPGGDAVQGHAEIEFPAGSAPPVGFAAAFDANLPKFANTFALLGALRARGEARATLRGGEIAVAMLSAELQTGTGRRLGALEAKQPFVFDTRTWQLRPQNASADVLTLSLGRLPLALVESFLSPGLAVGGEFAQSGFALKAEGDRLVLRTTTPLRVTGLSVAQAGRPLLGRLGLETTPAADYTSKELTVDLGTLNVTSGGSTLLTLKGGATLFPGTKTPGRARLSFDGNLATLLAQPALASYNGIAQGRLFGSAEMTLAARPEVSAKLSIDTLTARDTGRLLPVMNLSLKAGQQPKGDYYVEAALLVDSAGRRSDLTLKALARPDRRPVTFDARLSGTQLMLDDLQLLAGAFRAPGPASAQRDEGAPPAAGPEVAPKPGAEPFWHDFGGQAGVQIKQISYSDRWQAQDIAAVLKIEPGRLTLERADARFGEKSAFSAGGEVKFSAGAPQPYELAARLALTDFDTAPLFRALDPGKPPTVEGIFNVNGQATGKGTTLDTLIENTRGSVELNSKGGLFRGLRFSANTSKATQVLGGLLSIAGVKGAAEIDLAGQLAGLLSELPYDQLTIRATRDDRLNINLDEFSLLSPNVRLQGKGLVQHQPQTRLLDQPLHLELVLGARGPVEQILARSQQLSGEHDSLGYATFREPFVIGGTPSNPDTSQLKTLLTRSVLGGLLGR